jgi:hypothetical protein
MFARMSRNGPAVTGTSRHRLPGLPYSPAGNSLSRYQAAFPNPCSSRLLIRGFGVQVPGGAPVLTWGFTHSGLPREGHFRAMFAPRLLVSPDLVPRADRYARCGPYRWFTQRDNCRVVQPEGSHPCAARLATETCRPRRPASSNRLHLRRSRGSRAQRFSPRCGYRYQLNSGSELASYDRHARVTSQVYDRSMEGTREVHRAAGTRYRTDQLRRGSRWPLSSLEDGSACPFKGPRSEACCRVPGLGCCGDEDQPRRWPW